MNQPVEGFSKRSKEEKIKWLAEQYTPQPEQTISLLKQYWSSDAQLQQLHDEFIENTLTNFYLPLGVAPNFLINGNLYAIPMAIEESSVVAAASKAAKFWLERGGFHAQVLGTEKIGQVHFLFFGDPRELSEFIEEIRPILRSDAQALTRNMEKRGGGITRIELRDKTSDIKGYYQLHCTFETLDAMGANFINSCLEQFASTLLREAAIYPKFSSMDPPLEVLMSILSNYVPDCLVRAEVSCPVAELGEESGISGADFARRMVQAVAIADCEPHRAVTHNKGIMNGVDAVVLATGNDFRAVEAGVHAYAARSGRYRSLSQAEVRDGRFRFWMDIPLALGTVGGLTGLHPLVGLAHEILQKPSAGELMQIVAVAGLAQNFAALRSLVTVGIQKGHMKMHLLNILNQLSATQKEKENLIEHFKTNTVTHNAVVKALEDHRAQK
ncbi:hydroxymethylglutaryl-CoA reductase, degradative [Robiginitalea aurantiaca]|uniref:3-hydroxy-3-methylglutaryl coenzyme A reductase n=1 Tax=Robiginitalea aurantiaca TaxID=3056915 RepID=A0ABT7WF22_9FLAO|nr:hydroxymethylglutaryl-CoA reductase, degradative [Robiginitalea aurantiaca]MDM9631515.1 hydroxymethylglutaryl-CoA reductase, degradative [Robiginitalea aurantiaca]